MHDHRVGTAAAAQCTAQRATDAATQAIAAAAAAASQAQTHAQDQSRLDSLGTAYVATSNALETAAAARTADAGVMRKQARAIAAAASAAAAAPGDACAAQDRQVAGCAGLLGDGVGVVAAGVSLAQGLGAQLSALQAACAK